MFRIRGDEKCQYWGGINRFSTEEGSSFGWVEFCWGQNLYMPDNVINKKFY